ncbi:MAG TPA: Fic family protein, partial [Anaeromyxobacteraceae bacterium]|nr:Fic family protein [Anaeromyxobacteraceae bacterium]
MRTRYIDLDDRTQDLAECMRDEPAVAEDFLRKYELSWLYHENALEGVIYAVHELEAALENQPLAEASQVGPFQEVRNHKAAIDIIRAEAKAKRPRVNLTLVKRLYETLHSGLSGRNPAPEFRKDMPLHRAYFHEIAQPAKIPFLLGKLFDLYGTADFKQSHPLQQASRLQHGFMQVYPFTDGSGKVARLLANLLLLNQGYLPCIVHSIDRQRYYDSLRLPEPQLREIMLEAMENGLESAEKF